jgi:two-component system sensor histidine kinase RegB
MTTDATKGRGDLARFLRYRVTVNSTVSPSFADVPAQADASVAPTRRQGRREVADPSPEENHPGLSWLVRLRWGAIFGQLVAIGLARVVLAVDLPYLALVAVVVVTALTNGLLQVMRPTHERTWHLALVLGLDILLLTTLLALSGGASNPFTVFFLVHVALAALLLESWIAWGLVLVSVGAFGLLFLAPAGLVTLHVHGGSAHLVGMWVAYALAAAFVAHFVGKVSRGLRDRDQRLARVTRLAQQNERLATLSSFSANAAHELGSPLATIGLAAKELALAIRRAEPTDSLLTDAELVCHEVARCRDILADLSARAGESMGEMPVTTTPEKVLDEVQRAASPRLLGHLHVTFAGGAAQTEIVAPVRTLAQMLHNLVRNAFEAQEEHGSEVPVELHVTSGARVCFHVLDRGPGFSEEIRARLGEPFVTTKSSQGGLGLGIYLARAYAERTGGDVLFHAREGGGSDVELCLARDAIRGGHDRAA